mmetsp:Transcript_132677/g.229592  ORF Transcript_132677/g.229592 Transcript_132677/m.229592 type:complete len:209 (+) Transcript_132677:255-881(+)
MVALAKARRALLGPSVALWSKLVCTKYQRPWSGERRHTSAGLFPARSKLSTTPALAPAIAKYCGTVNGSVRSFSIAHSKPQPLVCIRVRKAKFATAPPRRAASIDPSSQASVSRVSLRGSRALRLTDQASEERCKSAVSVPTPPRKTAMSSTTLPSRRNDTPTVICDRMLRSARSSLRPCSTWPLLSKARTAVHPAPRTACACGVPSS